MIIIHKPVSARGAQICDLKQKFENPNYRRIRREKLRSGEYLTVDHNGYKLTRGKSDLVRVLPEEQEREYREILAQIAQLRQRASDVIEEGWVRAEPYIHPEPAQDQTVPGGLDPKVTPELRRDLDRLAREVSNVFLGGTRR